MNNLMTVSNQWATRPEDQRFLTLADLHAKVSQRRQESWTAAPETGSIRITAPEGRLLVNAFDRTQGSQRELKPSHWAFGQLASYARAPASYIRTLPAELAAINLQWGLEHSSVRENALVLARSNGDDEMRAMTSTSYGRIWDHQVVEAVQKVNVDGRWQVPAASYSGSNPLRATTLYASDRDVFLFLCDPSHPIEVPGENAPLFRGFYAWNSEVGSAVFGLATFLYRVICDNRIIWGATDIKELRIRHTGGAPDRFAYEGARYLKRYSEESSSTIVQQIVKAKETAVPINTGNAETVQDWLRKRGLTQEQAKASVETAQAEQGSARTIWDIVNGITAHARSIQNTDDRVALERQAGKLMEVVV